MSVSAATLLLRLLDLGLTITQTLADAGINYREVMDAQEKASKEGRELNTDERQRFISEAQSAVDKL